MNTGRKENYLDRLYNKEMSAAGLAVLERARGTNLSVVEFINKELVSSLVSSLTTPDSPDWDLLGSATDSWTLDFWIKITGNWSNPQAIINQVETGPNRWLLYTTSPTSIGMRFLVSAADYIPSCNGAWPGNDGKWHHVAWVKSGQNTGLYVDGKQIAYSSTGGLTRTYAGPLYIGDNGLSSGNGTEGYMAEIRIEQNNVFGASPNSNIGDVIVVPNKPAVATSYTKLLLHFDNNFIDSAWNSHVITANLAYIRENMLDVSREGRTVQEKFENIITTSFKQDFPDYFIQTPALYYKLDENAGNTTVQNSGYVLMVNGTASVNTSTLSNTGGTVGRCFKFDGSSQYVNLDSVVNNVKNDKVGTISLWINKDYLTTERVAFGFGDTDTETYLTINVATNGKIRAGFVQSATNHWSIDSEVTLKAGFWHHVVLVQDGFMIRMYVDGAIQYVTWLTNNDVTRWLYNITALIDNCRIGCQNNTSTGNTLFWNGKIDEVRYFQTPLNEAQVLALYRFGLGRIVQRTSLAGMSNAAAYCSIDDSIRTTSRDVLLLHMDGTNGGTTFIDETGKTVTANGNVNTSTAQKKFGSASALFDGTGDYLSLADSPDWHFGVSDFTVEFWFRYASLTNVDQGFFTHDVDNTNRLLAALDSGTKFVFAAVDASGNNVCSNVFPFVPVINTWYHIAFVRFNRGEVECYLNGNKLLSYVITHSLTGKSLPDYAATFKIGYAYHNGGTQYFNGYIDEFRISKYARYVGNFVPMQYEYYLSQSTVEVAPTYTTSVPEKAGAALVLEDTSPTLMLQGNRLLENNITYDLSGRVLTISGSVTIEKTNSRFGDGSIYFNGSSHITVPDSTDWYFNTGDFTIEFWIKFNSIASGCCAICQYNSSTDYWRVLFDFGSHNVRFQAEDGVQPMLNCGANLNDFNVGIWYHVAFSRAGSYCKLFLNGKTINSITSTYALQNISTPLVIGSMNGSFYVDGYMDDIIVHKGYAKYKNDFVPAQYRYGHENINVRFARDSRVLTLRFEGADASTNIVSDEGKVATVYGNAQIDTAQYKYGSSSLLLDGTGDYISLPDSDDWYFGNEDFTIEMWLKPNVIPGGNGAYIYAQYVDSNNYMLILINPNGAMQLTAKENGVSIGNYSGAVNDIVAGSWQHLVILRNGSSLYMFVDGIAKSFTPSTAIGTLPNFSAPLIIGDNSLGTAYYNGWIDNFVIRKGIAAYTSNFTPSSIVDLWSPAQTLIPVDSKQDMFAVGGGKYMTGDMSLLEGMRLKLIRTKLEINGLQTTAIKGITTHWR